MKFNKIVRHLRYLVFLCCFAKAQALDTNLVNRIRKTENTQKINTENFEKVLPKYKNQNHFVDRISDFSVVNTGYIKDSGTRFYIMPKTTVTRGTGGTLKVFGDNFLEDGINYRDLGIYFSADQRGEKGTHGNGAFYINSKINGVYYPTDPIANGQWPDIVFSFQDGSKKPGRFIFDQPSNASLLWLRHETPNADNSYAIKQSKSEVGAEGEEIAFYKFTGKLGNTGDLAWQIRYDSSLGGNVLSSQFPWKYYSGSKQIANISDTDVWFDAPVRLKTFTYDNIDQDFLNGSKSNIFKINNSVQNNISNAINCKEGQEITIVFMNNNTTLNHNSKSGQPFILEGSIDFKGNTSDIIKLICINDKLIEVSRSIK